MQQLPPWTPVRALTTFATGPWAIVTLAVEIIVVLWYLQAVKVLSTHKSKRWPVVRTVCFAGGVLSVAAAWQSSISPYASRTFIDHVMQHVLLMLAAPILLSLGAPVTLAMQTVRRVTKVRMLRFFASRPWKCLAHPLPANLGNYGIMYWFFLAGGIIPAMNHPALMDFVNTLFLFFGCLVWWPLLSIDWIGRRRFTYPARLGLSALAMPFDSFLAIALLGGAAHNSVDPQMYSLANTHAGASVFWIVTGLITSLMTIAIAAQWATKERQVNARADRMSDKGIYTGGSPIVGWAGEVQLDTDGTMIVPWADAGIVADLEPLEE
ncbi:MAG: cytochrome c oxidase assembly protein [Actinobacteria bacterium]|nr:cytochrome c oxidase assembly protein [Actinomycetota bacterium]